MKKISASAIKKTLDKWVAGVGTGRYQPGNYVDDLDNSYQYLKILEFSRLRLKFINL